MNEETLKPPLPILMVDDEEPILTGYDMALRLGGYTNLVSCTDSRKVLETVRQKGAAVVLLDLTMPHISGEAILCELAQNYPQLPIVVATGNDSLETAVKCMKDGAFDFIVKPIDRDRLLTTVRQALSFAELSEENRLLGDQLQRRELMNPEVFSKIVTNNSEMRALFQYVEAIAPSSQPVLITGETGVGKELLARAVHDSSGRNGAFIAVNVAGLDESVFSDTLFGHIKGAYTGADTPRKGMIEQAAGGTLFLDEIGDLSPALQMKLLRLVQEGEYHQLGADLPKQSDARIVVATHKNLESLQADGTFRKDLYYRLRIHKVVIPPLRQRLDDISLLVDHFLADAAKALGKKVPTPPKELAPLLSSYDFPGNVRELHAMVFDAVGRHKSMMLSMNAFKEHIVETPDVSSNRRIATENLEAAGISFGLKLPTMNETKDLIIEEALKRTGGNKSLAATMLGMTRQALTRREKNTQK